MKSAIEEMWYGNIDSQENMNISDDPDIKQLISYMIRHMDELTATLTNKQKEMLEKYNDCRNEYESKYHETIFAYGFRLGARMMLDIVNGEVSL